MNDLDEDDLRPTRDVKDPGLVVTGSRPQSSRKSATPTKTKPQSQTSKPGGGTTPKKSSTATVKIRNYNVKD